MQAASLTVGVSVFCSNYIYHRTYLGRAPIREPLNGLTSGAQKSTEIPTNYKYISIRYPQTTLSSFRLIMIIHIFL